MATVRQQHPDALTDDRVIEAAERLFGTPVANAIARGSWGIGLDQRPLAGRRLKAGEVARLRQALDVADMLLDVEAEETVRAWFAGKNPILGDRAPAVVIAEDPERVRFAARDLLAHG